MPTSICKEPQDLRRSRHLKNLWRSILLTTCRLRCCGRGLRRAHGDKGNFCWVGPPSAIISALYRESKKLAGIELKSVMIHELYVLFKRPRSDSTVKQLWWRKIGITAGVEGERCHVRWEVQELNNKSITEAIEPTKGLVQMHAVCGNMLPQWLPCFWEGVGRRTVDSEGWTDHRLNDRKPIGGGWNMRKAIWVLRTSV